MLATHPAQIPHPAFHIVGRKKRIEIGCCMGAKCFPCPGIRCNRGIHEINTFFKRRSDAVIYCEHSSFFFSNNSNCFQIDKPFPLESRGFIGLNISDPGLVSSLFSCSNILKTDLAEMFNPPIIGQRSSLLEEENAWDQIIC